MSDESLSFEVEATDPSGARAGVVTTRHGRFRTPVFMPVGTLGTVKGLSTDDLEEIGSEIILGNAYHLWVRPGDERIQSHQDLDDPQFTIAVQEGTTGEQAAQRLMPQAALLRFPKTDEACLAVIQEKADAVVFDHPYLVDYVLQQPGKLEGIWTPFTEEQIAAIVEYVRSL